MNPLRRIDRFSSQHPILTDGLVALVLLFFFGIFSAPSWFTTGYGYNSTPWWVMVGSMIAMFGHTVPWAWRRVRPVLSAALITGASLVHLFFGQEMLGTMILVPMTVYNLAVRAPHWASLAGLGTGLFGAVAYGIMIGYFPRPYVYPDGSVETTFGIPGVGVALVVMVLAAAIVLVAWALGDVKRTRHLALQQLTERAWQLEVEAQQERELAAADERNHIAREMHDIVAHSLQVVISQADGGRYAGTQNPRIAVETLETISETGRSALAQMRLLLGVLRGSDEVEHRPQPGLDDVTDLLDTVRLTGLDITFHTVGTPRRELPAGGGLVVYRLIQEALTNTVRHAGPKARATVQLTWSGAGVDITVDDDGRGAAADATTAGSGQGLVGMQERVALYGGTCEAGPRPGGGFRMHATLPYQEL